MFIPNRIDSTSYKVMVLGSGRSRIFPEWGVNPQVGALGYEFIKISPKTAWNWEKFGRWGACPGSAPLASATAWAGQILRLGALPNLRARTDLTILAVDYLRFSCPWVQKIITEINWNVCADICKWTTWKSVHSQDAVLMSQNNFKYFRVNSLSNTIEFSLNGYIYIYIFWRFYRIMRK